MPELTIEQRSLLGKLRDAKAARTTVKARVEAENRQRLADALRDADTLMNRTVRECWEAGVSKRRIGVEGLGTSDQTTVNKLLAKTAGEAAVAAAIGKVAAPAPIRELTREDVAARFGHTDPDADLFVELRYPAFPTRWRGAVDEYPNPLTGVLKRVFGLWSVVSDPDAALEWELAEWEPNDGVLKRILDAYAEGAR